MANIPDKPEARGTELAYLPTWLLLVIVVMLLAAVFYLALLSFGVGV